VRSRSCRQTSYFPVTIALDAEEELDAAEGLGAVGELGGVAETDDAVVGGEAG
jgi:hypothetical protein